MLYHKITLNKFKNIEIYQAFLSMKMYEIRNQYDEN